MLKFCGFVVGRDISAEQMGRLFDFLHANFAPADFLALNDEELNFYVLDNKAGWF